MASVFQFALFLCLASGLMATKHCSKEEPSPCPVCPPGWTQFGVRCFYYVNEQKKWWDAEHKCLSLGGNLASILSDEEQQFVREHIQRVTNVKKAIWIGGYDAVKEGIWFWSDGNKVDFTKWGENQPDNNKKQHCMALDIKNDSWKDEKCRTRRRFLCSRDLPCPGKPSSHH